MRCSFPLYKTHVHLKRKNKKKVVWVIYENDSTCRFISDKIFFSGWSVSSDKADSLGVRLEFMKEGQHHRNKTADWSELSRIHYPRRILTPTKFRRLTEEAGLGVKREKKYFIENKTTGWVVYEYIKTNNLDSVLMETSSRSQFSVGQLGSIMRGRLDDLKKSFIPFTR